MHPIGIKKQIKQRSEGEEQEQNKLIWESKFIRLKRLESSDLQGPQRTTQEKTHQCA